MERTLHLMQQAHPANIFRAVATPFQAVRSFVSTLVEAKNFADAVERLDQTSDAALSAKGLTRKYAFERITNDHFVV